ncbi:MAG: LamG domain-containing protein [Thaumarchaeota archaeon]|nr:LamG domain-containing protein [Nitrososphaerota archaeon]
MSASTKIAGSMRIVGYADRLSVEPGQKIRFMVSCLEPSYRADVVRLIHGDENPAGPGFKSRMVGNVSRSLQGRAQTFRKGSYIRVKNRPSLRDLSSFTLQAWIRPTTPGRGSQSIVSQGENGTGFTLVIGKDGRLELQVRDAAGATWTVRSDRELMALEWYFVAASYDGKTGRISLRQSVVASCRMSDGDSSAGRVVCPGLLSRSRADLLIAASAVGRETASHYNGKIDGVKVYSRALSDAEIQRLSEDVPPSRIRGLVAAWDFAHDTHSVRIKDLSGGRTDGTSVNFPTRVVTGHNWSGHDYDFKRAPREYNAIWFHDDDLGDAGWEVDFEYPVPENARSGVYAAWLRTDGSEDYIPFFVRPKKGKPTAKIALLIPTLSYLAYANEHALSDPNVRRALNISDEGYPRQRQDAYIVENNLLSLYDRHTDGSGVCYSSRLRPIASMRPKYVSQSLSSGKGSPHQFNADLHLVDWLEAKGYRFDVITDEDLHHEGSELLAPYRAIVTGSHPEYWTEQMLDSMQSYLNGGGRMMYLGGNGFYWVTTVNPESPYIFEVRRWGGTGPWMTDPGEYYSSFTGELGGTWRNRGRHPQKMVGVGFTAQGFDLNRPYEQDVARDDPRVSFIVEGIGKDELIGDFPSLVMGAGAAGFELDRFDRGLGSPAHSLRLATASGFSDSYQHVIEENSLADDKQGGRTHPLVKADIAYVGYPRGGAVFSVGSISWCGSLSYNGYENNVSRMTGNVLTRFASDEALP